MFAFLPDFMGEWYFFATLIVLLLALVGILLFLRNKRPDDD
jgi:hypothetical protein